MNMCSTAESSGSSRDGSCDAASDIAREGERPLTSQPAEEGLISQDPSPKRGFNADSGLQPVMNTMQVKIYVRPFGLEGN